MKCRADVTGELEKLKEKRLLLMRHEEPEAVVREVPAAM